MPKKYDILIIVFIVVVSGFMLKDSYKASAWMNPCIFGGSSQGLVCDDCSGNRKVAYHAEGTNITSGTPCGCSDGETVFTVNNSPTFSSTNPYDGSYSLRVDGNSEYISLAKNGTTEINIDDIKLTFELFIEQYPSANLIIFDVVDSPMDWTNYLQLKLTTAGYIQAVREGQNAQDTIMSASACATNSWLTVEYQADHAHAGSSNHYIGIDGMAGAAESDSILTQDDDTTEIRIGADGNFSGGHRLDAFDWGPADRWD